MKTILSIQSQVSFGAVGNTLATMVAHAMDVDIAAVNTISLVAHPGYGLRAGGAADDADMEAILSAIGTLDLWDRIGMVATGYMAKESQVLLTQHAINQGKNKRKPPIPILVDPAFGDHGRHYNDTAIAYAIDRHLLPLADIITPNRFEASFLSGIDIFNAATAATAGREILAKYPDMQVVIITGIIKHEHCLDMLIRRDDISEHSAPTLTHNKNGFAGGGDLFASLLSGNLIKGHGVDQAFAETARQASQILSDLDKRQEKNITRQAIASGLA
tara:strand:+ start:876 stop:1697 length:822 start_codon:yes stop_codon:yes gene_type:complete